MAKLKNNFSRKTVSKLPLLKAGGATSGAPNVALPHNQMARSLGSTSSGSVSQVLNFGSMHTKPGSASNTGSQWTSLLTNASGGASSIIGGGLLSVSGLGLIGKLFNLFGGGKTPPVAPVQFQSPVAQQESLDITVAGAASSVSLGVHNSSATRGGAYQHAGSTVSDQAAQSAQVVQIVKRALLTSSSLNDVISEI